MKTVLVVGSVNMDYTVYVSSFPKEGETIFGSSRFIQPGGKGQNQAVALAKSNKVNVSFIGSIGKDSDGEEMRKIHKEYGIRSFLKESKESTGNATIIVDEKSENKIIVVPGANGDILKEDIDLSVIEKSDFVVLQNEIPYMSNKYVIEEANRLGKVVVYNAAPFREVEDELLNKVDYLVVNQTELYGLSSLLNVDEAVKLLIDKGVKNILVTLGKEGSVLYKKDGIIRVKACPVTAVDTVAAGDTFVGYFVASLASGMDEKTSMEIASKASSITVTRKGSVVSIPFGEEVY